MPKLAAAIAALPFALIIGAPGFAQEAAAPAMPAACQTAAGEAAAATVPGNSMSNMDNMRSTASMPAADEAHTALMMGMGTMMQNMMMGSMVPNFDVAFVCSMLPHHLGAISMAQAELKYGKDPWARQLAQSIVD
ncbi:MAG: hypothetical protein JWQ89_1360, partial [Devosia sp.]|uniref:DUF305 domain-containing protein n=1 Tax=Devosia sp. TaxID=1871048 RepID=UPI00261BADB3